MSAAAHGYRAQAAIRIEREGIAQIVDVHGWVVEGVGRAEECAVALMPHEIADAEARMTAFLGVDG